MSLPRPAAPLAVACLALAPVQSASAQCSPSLPVETGQLVPTPAADLRYGLDADGHTVVAGAPQDSGWTGAVYVFERDEGGPGNWGQTARLLASDAALDARFGWDVAISGDVLVVGAPNDDSLANESGSAYVFERDAAGDWSETRKLTAVAPFFGISESKDHFGNEVAVRGDRILVGATDETVLPNYTSNGATYFFERDEGGPGNWGSFHKIFTGYGGAFLQIDGKTAVIRWGVHKENNGGAGNWGQVATVLGWQVSLDGDTLLSSFQTSGLVGQNSGAAWIQERDLGGNENWGQRAVLTASDAEWGDQFGNDIALVGEAALVACFQDDAACPLPGQCNSGSVYLFGRNTGGPKNWGEIGSFVNSDNAANQLFGTQLAATGSTVFVSTGYVTGGARIYVFEGLFSSPASGYCTAGTTASGCQAQISASGTPSASLAAGFAVIVSGVEGQKDGTLYFSTQGAQANPWGNGTSFQCVVPPVKRTGVQQGTGTLGACDTVYQLDFNAWMTAHPTSAPAAGATTYMQSWFRDPANTSNQSTSLSGALMFTVCP